MTTSDPEAGKPATAAEPLALRLNDQLGQASEALHVAVCQAVALLNRAPEVARCAEGREARDMLRQALVDYADAYMDRPVTEQERAAVARKHQRTYTQADLLEAAKTERHACSIAVWMTLQDALEPGADDKGLEGWMREAEERVKRRLEGRQ